MNTQEEKPKKSWRDANRVGLQFYGWKQGVPVWRGSWKKGPPLWFCRMFLGLTGAMLTLSLLFLFLLPSSARSVGSLSLSLESLVFGFVTGMLYRQRRNLLSVKSAEEAGELLGMDSEAIQRLAENNKIKPRYIINDEPMYNLNDFDEKGILLRASEAPLSQEMLLRPATGQPQPQPEELLRPSATTLSPRE